MRDPHVSALVYRLETDETVAFDDPPPLEHETDAFRVRLADGVLRVEMKEHHPSEQCARERVEPYVRAWELSEALNSGWRTIRFVFERAEIVDREPPSPGKPRGITIEVETGRYQIVGYPARLIHGRRRYPEPTAGFAVSPDVETMWNRYEGYRAGREPLTSMAYMCLTVLEAIPDSRNTRIDVAKRYGIHPEVLSTLGRLTTVVGDERSARKAHPTVHFRPHTAAEIAWTEAVVRALIRRVGEWAADRDGERPKLTMSDFPPLE